jgi:hypothetical protein
MQGTKLASLVGALSIVLGIWATSAQAQTQYSLSGNARYQIGDGLPIPIRATPAPDGGVKVGNNAGGFLDGTAVVSQKGSDPMTITMPKGLAKNPAFPINIDLLSKNPAVFQVNTTVVASFPAATKTFKANGRQGYKTVAWCPGDGPITASGNPACADPATGGTGGNVINGRMIYTKKALGNQFGGNAGVRFTGAANVALNIFASNDPETGCGGNPCKVRFALATPVPIASPTSQASFGQTGMSPGAAPNPGAFTANMTNNGKILTLGNTSPSPAGITNKATSFQGPWTTGMLTVSVTNISPPETFVLSGSDNRVNGVGSLSLVAGTIALRAASGGNANRGWLNFELAEISQTPSMSPAGLMTLAGLMIVGGGYGAMRFRSRKNS